MPILYIGKEFCKSGVLKAMSGDIMLLNKPIDQILNDRLQTISIYTICLQNLLRVTSNQYNSDTKNKQHYWSLSLHVNGLFD